MAINKIPPPSTTAQYNEFIKCQSADEPAFYDGRYTENGKLTIAPPIQIYHSVFESFLTNLASPNFKPSEEVIKHVSKLMQLAAKLFPDEATSNKELMSLLDHVLGQAIVTVVLADRTVADGAIITDCGSFSVRILTAERENGLGVTGCDVVAQVECSALKCIGDTTVRWKSMSILILSDHAL